VKNRVTLRKAFEAFEQFTVAPRSGPNSFYLDFADALYRSPLFAAPRMLRPGVQTLTQPVSTSTFRATQRPCHSIVRPVPT